MFSFPTGYAFNYGGRKTNNYEVLESEKVVDLRTVAERCAQDNGYEWSGKLSEYSWITGPDEYIQDFNYTVDPNNEKTFYVGGLGYKLTYDYQGTGENWTMFVNWYGSGYTLSDATYGNYTFRGWWTEPNGGGRQVTSFDPKVEKQNLTVYPKWVSVISFNSDGGTSFQNYEVIKGKAVSLSQNPTLGNYTFRGWWTGLNGTGSQISNGYVPTGNMTICAKWVSVVNYYDFQIEMIKDGTSYVDFYLGNYYLKQTVEVIKGQSTSLYNTKNGGELGDPRNVKVVDVNCNESYRRDSAEYNYVTANDNWWTAPMGGIGKVFDYNWQTTLAGSLRTKFHPIYTGNPSAKFLGYGGQSYTPSGNINLYSSPFTN